MKLASEFDFFIIRESVLKKTETAFADLLLKYEKIISENGNFLPKEVFHSRGKISKGERLENCPWMALDYPRFFDKENIFLFRTLFWWGHFFSFNLVLSGHYSKPFLEPVLKNAAILNSRKFFLYTGNNVWENNLENKAFIKTQQTRNLNAVIEEVQSKRQLIKVSGKLEVKKWDRLIETGQKTLLNFLQLIH